MSGCPDQAELLQAYFDGELDAANAQAFEAHLAACPGCSAALDDLRMLRERLADPALREPAPESLRRRIEATLAAEAPAARPRGHSAGVLPWGLSAGFGALAAALAAVAVLPSTGALETQLVADHVRSTLGTRLVDVETSDRHTVKPWFNGKVDFAPPVVDLAEAGFPLEGGRLDYLDGRRVAALVYRRNRHVINLFVWPQTGPPRLPALGRSHEGYAIVHWTQGGLQFWAVSDVDRGELQAFARLFAQRTGS
ncbi:MAG TPA: anti-sigma factor [Phenylobacterium sp.]|uniref:anti-sigma factor family protein n=1 Tax=Phenylobacterium sp. TaxID=1871053 RepID=UPI002CC70A8B|nr:anti-sigma factor [Phenylobacterium sp.]HSV01934.1 anti-sigma factor [Phenylobacterium sp.]